MPRSRPQPANPRRLVVRRAGDPATTSTATSSETPEKPAKARKPRARKTTEPKPEGDA